MNPLILSLVLFLFSQDTPDTEITAQTFVLTPTTWQQGNIGFGDIKDFMPPDAWHPHGLCEATVWVEKVEFKWPQKVTVFWTCQTCPPEAEGEHDGWTFIKLEAYSPKWGMVTYMTEPAWLREGYVVTASITVTLPFDCHGVFIHAEVSCDCHPKARCGNKWHEQWWVKYCGLVEER